MRFSDVRIGVRLMGVVVLSAIAILAVGSVAVWDLRQTIVLEREAKIKEQVTAAASVIRGYMNVPENQGKDLTQQKAEAMALIAAMRPSENAYVWINDMDGVFLMHPVQKALVGTNLKDLKDKATGQPLFTGLLDMIKSRGEGYQYYNWTNNPGEAPSQKISYLMAVKGWGWVIGSGATLSDVDITLWRQGTQMGLIGGAILLALIAVAYVLVRSVVTPLRRLAAIMTEYGENRYEQETPFTTHKDEIGAIARALNVFKNRGLDMRRMAEERAESQAQASEERRNTRRALADRFEASVKPVVQAVSEAAEHMKTSASTMADSARDSEVQVRSVANASDRAALNVNMVAGATEQLSASILDIGQQVATSTQYAAQAAADAQKTDTMMRGLTEAASQIGAVIELINSIAGQTNLLALNATIEAARAGEAGKGFAVVASEVKALASQTARATEEIQSKVQEIQGATGNAADAIKAIGETITRINSITTTVAAAVEQQTAATREIAQSIQMVAGGTQEVSSNVEGLTDAANHTGSAAQEVLDAAGNLAEEARILHTEIDGFLGQIRAG